MKNTLFLLLVLSMRTLIAQTTVTFQPDAVAGEDASLGSHTNFGTESNNYGTNIYFNAYCIAGAAGGQNTNRAIIRFDLSSIPTTAVIQSADLYLYATGYINGLLPGHFGNNSSSVERITTAWTESGVTWNTAPTTTTLGSVSVPQSTSAAQNYMISVTTMTQYMIANPALNYGYYFRNVTENPATPSALLFWSSDYSNSNLRPKLVITYHDTNPKSVEAISIGETDIELFPNPSTQHIVIRSGELSDAVVNIYSADGRLVKTVQYNGTLSEYFIPVAELADGTYLGEFLAENKRGLARFIKQQ